MTQADIAALLALGAAVFIAIGDVIHQRTAHQVTDEQDDRDRRADQGRGGPARRRRLGAAAHSRALRVRLGGHRGHRMAAGVVLGETLRPGDAGWLTLIAAVSLVAC